MSLVNQAVVDAIIAGNTRITRRAEIYETDGLTPFNLAPRVKSGQVSVDYSRNDRRNFDLVLDNSDESIIHDPATGLWYDKVIKIFRGIKYTNLNKAPRIALLGVASDSTAIIISVLRRIGMTDITFFPLTALPSISDVLSFDIIVAWAQDTDLDAGVALIASAAYSAGKSVFTACNYATGSSVPVIATNATRSTGTNWDINPPAFDNQFASALSPYVAPYHTGETVPLTVTSGARIAATTTYSSAQVPACITQASNSGGKWFHYHPKMSTTITPSVNVALFLSLIKAGVSWLYSYGATVDWETQVGEFMIDKIGEPRFPREYKISGRDYAKRLALSKYDQTVTYIAGTDVDTLVRAIAANGGIFKCKLGGLGLALLADYTFTRNTARMDSIVQICAGSNLEVFFDAFGYLVTRPFRDPALAPISLNLKMGRDAAGNGSVVSMEKSSDDSRLFNKIIVTGASASSAIQGTTFEGIAENHEPSSPTRIERIGERTQQIDMPSFTSDQQCLDFATQVLKVSALESYDLNFSTLVFPWLEAGEITQYTDAVNLKDPTRFLLTNFNIPLDLSAQTGNAKRVSIVG